MLEDQQYVKSCTLFLPGPEQFHIKAPKVVPNLILFSNFMTQYSYQLPNQNNYHSETKNLPHTSESAQKKNPFYVISFMFKIANMLKFQFHRSDKLRSESALTFYNNL